MMRSIAITTLLSAALFSCNPVKRVLKNPEWTNAVVSDWVLNNPMPSDTLYKPGDTVVTVKDSLRVDTLIRYEVRNDTIVEVREKIVTKTIYTTKTVTDTVTVVDRSRDQFFRDAIKAQQDAIAKLKSRVTAYNNERWMWRILALFGIIATVIILWKR